eukprot:SRR837773.4247.p1 GENE.SRR837773.4247~~SRR837773.4247.p1  ORF type:complete len:576 (-),score=265.26 SRR837773.4247:68-1795(-)
MSKSQERFFGFTRRRTEQEESFRESRSRMVSQMEASELRCLGKQRDLIEQQRRRAFNNAQKRSEQQKVLREVQKEKERLWEAYYEQSHKSSGSQANGKGGGSEPGSPKSPGSRGSSKVGSAGGGDMDILRSVHQSHSQYMGQLDQWRQFVAENERRTDVQWKKVLQGGRKEDYIGEELKTSKERFHKAFNKVVAGRVFKKTLMSKVKPSKREEAPAEPEASASEVSPQDAAADEGGSPFGASKSASSSSPCSPARFTSELSVKWRERRAQTLNFHENFEQMLQEKGERDEENLAEARERIRLHNKGIQDRCKEQARLWQEKCDAAAQRRKNVAEADTEEYDRKYAACLQRLKDEDEKRRARARAEGEDHARKVQKCKDTSRSLEQAFIDSTVASLAKLDAAMIERDSIKKAEVDARRARDKFQERLDQAKEKKADDQKAALRKARKEMLAKRSRSELALTNLHMSALDRERQRRQRRKAGLDVSGELASPSGAADGGIVLPRLSGTMSLPILLRPVDASPILPPPRRKPEDSGSEAEESDGDDGRSSKAEFLEHLESSCGLWLTDLRKNMRLAVV